MTAAGATQPFVTGLAKVGNPPRAAIRGSSKPSAALDPSQRLKPTRSGYSRTCLERIESTDDQYRV
jgi:hypothetical protein